MSQELLGLVQSYVALGLAVVPIRAPTGNGPGAGKAPKIKDWQNKKLTFDEFKSFYTPGDNVGVVCGQLSGGLVCLDIDARNGGLEWYKANELALGEPVKEFTGGGGFHLYYKSDKPVRSVIGLAKGVDLLADGGHQVVVSPSVHPSGGIYRFEDNLDLEFWATFGEAMPDWVLNLIPPENPTPHLNGNGAQKISNPNIQAAIEAVGAFPPAISGQAGDSQTFKAACIIRDYGLPASKALELLSLYYNPRCSPLWSDVELKKKVRNAYTYANSPIGSKSAEVQFEATSELQAVGTTTKSGPVIAKREPVIVNAEDFALMPLPAKKFIIGPFIKQGLVLVYAPAGVGKTYFCLGLAFAAATGGEFLKWRATEKTSVLYIDGELQAATLQERIKPLVAAARLKDSTSIPFEIFTPDFQGEMSIPDLSTKDGQGLFSKAIERAGLIIVDNISCLCRTGKENEAESWIPVQDWALKLRRQGKSVFFVHHAGKGEQGSPRGTSKREDAMDHIVGLSHDVDREADDACEFNVRFRKARHYQTLIDVRAFHAKMVNDVWECEDMEERNVEIVKELAGQGLTMAAIAEVMAVHKSTISRLATKHNIKLKGAQRGRPGGHTRTSGLEFQEPQADLDDSF